MQRVRTIILIYFIYAPLILVNSSFCSSNKNKNFIKRITYGPQIQNRRACCERATQPYLFRGGGTIYPGSRPAGVTTCSPRMVIECILTRSMLIKLYKFIISWYVPVYVHCIYSQSISCRCSLSLFSLSNCINVLFDTTILSESMNMSYHYNNYPLW